MYSVFLKYYHGMGGGVDKASDQACLKVVTREKSTDSFVPC